MWVDGLIGSRVWALGTDGQTILLQCGDRVSNYSRQLWEHLCWVFSKNGWEKILDLQDAISIIFIILDHGKDKKSYLQL